VRPSGSIDSGAQAIDPDPVDPAETLAGFAAVWADAPFFVEPQLDAPHLQLADFEGKPRRERLGHTVAVQVRGTKGEFVEVSAPPRMQAKPPYLPELDPHCGWFDWQEPSGTKDATLFVRRNDLAPVLSEVHERTFEDGSALRLLPGTAVLLTQAGALASAGTLTVPLTQGVRVRHSYAAVPPPFSSEGEPHLKLIAVTNMQLGNAPVHADAFLSPLAHRVEPARGNGSEERVLFPFRTRCSALQVSVPRRAVQAYTPEPPKALGTFGVGGLGVGGLGGAHVLPPGTPLRTPAGRVIAKVQAPLRVDPKAGPPCVTLKFGISTRFLAAPKLKTSPAEVVACGNPRDVVEGKPDSGLGLATLSSSSGTGLAGIGTISAGEQLGSVVVRALEVDGELQPGVVRRVLAARMGALRFCYERQLNREPKLAGTLTFEIAVSAAGKVTHVNRTASSLSSQDVESCAVRQLRALTFPEANATTRIKSMTLEFSSKPALGR
jgi:hypothetical protein